MAGSGQPDWAGLLKWSLAHSDGTAPAREISDEERQWFAEAMKAHTVDDVAIMQQIGAFLVKESEDGVSEEEMVQTKEDLLQELMDIVDHVDRARDLKVIGGFQTVIDLLKSKHDGLRSRAAELVSVVVQNNLVVQEWALGFGVLPVLVTLLKDEKATVVVKSILALSSLVQNYPAAIAALKEEGGLGKVCELVASDDPRTKVKAMRLVANICVTKEDCTEGINETTKTIIAAISNEDAQIREAALRLLSCWTSKLKPLPQEYAPQLKQAVEARLAAIRGIAPGEDRDAVMEEEDLCGLIVGQI
uniref:TOG domain-containing protein n=1 Tax=Pyramimonas obovata TaxID=1411642 RepID=A0A7S0RII3_9CHLO|mmetsp:Transcript_3492/g.7276  ORF Transcript_3492/g.7276 Transcript_3492/m.7276 type:complete len:304 (+) Transcript_3492:84-995(+)|eukprot:CAMPEP_0118931684 /NCGR_PEP_ID=MMETSP1169-20130426/7940_1 /TAXON_ID=36882 /ORGANISM="Pyramimonas obovata, Strain CCMP722" /LENGTH=303 /DNA_ID=CAMNT_0006874211 /DNA_START=74 /DNA_END=985 /DNA_ORIENTATION=-